MKAPPLGFNLQCVPFGKCVGENSLSGSWAGSCVARCPLNFGKRPWWSGRRIHGRCGCWLGPCLFKLTGCLAFREVACTTPLLRPSDALTTRAVLHKLRLKTNGSQASFDDCPQKFHISYDVYNPNVHFRKSAPRLPNYRVVIANSEDKVPKLSDLQSTLGTISDKVPLLFAIVSESDIAFYTPYLIDLPLDITMG